MAAVCFSRRRFAFRKNDVVEVRCGPNRWRHARVTRRYGTESVDVVFLLLNKRKRLVDSTETEKGVAWSRLRDVQVASTTTKTGKSKGSKRTGAAGGGSGGGGDAEAAADGDQDDSNMEMSTPETRALVAKLAQQKTPPVPYRFKLNQIVLAKWTDGKWYRARVTKRRGRDAVDIVYREFDDILKAEVDGNEKESKVPFKRVKELTKRRPSRHYRFKLNQVIVRESLIACTWFFWGGCLSSRGCIEFIYIYICWCFF